MSEQSVDEANPFGKTPEEIDRSNRWFRVALALGKQDDYIKMLQTERRLGRTGGDHVSEQQQACKKCGAYGGNGRLPRIDDTMYPCPACSQDGVG